MIDAIQKYWENLKHMTITGWIISYLTVLLSPIAPFFAPIVVLIALDIISGIKASQKELQTKNVISSKKWSDKIKLLTPFVLGLAAVRITEHSLVGFTNINIFGVEINEVLTKVWIGIFIINELISILENVSRMGYSKADPFIKMLRIKEAEIIDKLEDKKDEDKKE